MGLALTPTCIPEIAVASRARTPDWSSAPQNPRPCGPQGAARFPFPCVAALLAVSRSRRAGRMAGAGCDAFGSVAGRADRRGVHPSGRSKRLRLRRADRCLACGRELAVGDEALWHRDIRRVTCVGCPVDDTTVVEGAAGASALREYARRRQRREEHARERLGGLGALLARVIDEPTSTKVWRQGANGEIRSAARFAKHLDGTAVRLLHDRTIPGHGRANIDHLAVGPGGVTVIDTKPTMGRSASTASVDCLRLAATCC
jgi:hypothetical protein